jgi:hypothetical protein
MTEATKKHDIGTLNQLYNDADSVDADVFAEMRTNVLLVSGEHYAKKNSKLWSRIRDSKQLSDEQKLRLTKNHTQRITKTYVNNIVSYTPGVAILPKNETERQDQKAAELNDAVWQDGKEQLDYPERVLDWADDFVNIGEVATKLFWNPNAGPIKHFAQKTTPQGENLFIGEDGKETTDPRMDMFSGQPLNKPAPGDAVFRGALCNEDIYGFNLLRPKNAKSLSKAAWLGLRKMTDIEEVRAWVANDPEKLKMISPDQDKTYIVFDAATGGYGNTENQVLIKEIYFRPSVCYPRGFYYIFTETGILFEGELPFGIFPIIVQPFEKIQTTPRGRSIIKVLRPYQVEINRTASKIAEHHITLGDDKLLIQKGTQLTQGGVLPGIRGVQYSGKEPGILNGRDGSQFSGYQKDQIAEMYEVAMVAEDSAENASGQLDPMAMLFRSASQKKKFTRYTRRFEAFLSNFTKTYLRLAKEYYTDDILIPAIGRREMVNIQEFRSSDDMCYQIKVEAQNDDLETKFGKLMGINHTLQYVGSKLEKEDIGKLLRAMPYANQEEAFGDFTLDYDTANNILLALDRGEIPRPVRQMKPEYILQRLDKRMQEADFQFLDPKIQANYEQTHQGYTQMAAQNLEEIRRAEAGYIPTDGYMVTVDLYVSEPGNPNKVKRARIPYSSVVWLIKAIEKQGLSQDALEGLDQSTQASVASQLNRGQGGGMGAGMPNRPPIAGMRPPNRMMPNGGAEMPQGELNGHGTITQPIVRSLGTA